MNVMRLSPIMRRTFRITFTAVALISLIALNNCVRKSDVTDLSGDWEYKLGFDESYLTDASTWEKIYIPSVLHKTLKLGSEHSGWLTLRRKIPSTFKGTDASILYTGWNSDVCIYYIDGLKVGQVGSVDPYEPGAYRNSIIHLTGLKELPEHAIAIAMYSNGKFPFQIFGPEMEIGSASLMQRRLTTSEIISFSLLAMYLIVGGYHLLLFASRRKDLHNLMFGIFCTLLTLYWVFRTNFRDEVFGSSVMFRTKLEYVILFMIGPNLMFFLSQFFHKRFTRVGIFFLIIWSGMAAVVVFTDRYSVTSQVLQIWQVTSIFALLYVAFYLIREAVRKNRDALWLLATFLVLLLFIFHDLFVSLLSLDAPHLARFSFIVFVMGIAAVLARHFTRIHSEVEELNEHLELKVRQRTDELTKTLDRVEQLKVQQDGDYFLTSLLIQPLAGNFAGSRNVSVDMLIRQKKQFRFKHWEAEIGGDLSIANNVTLRGKGYTVFLNGDAMGKSIQGAGGALVLGTVFKSVIARTHASSQVQSKYPETWLKEMFLELQSVFVSFDGSMLVSAVFGLVDELSGLVYYVNAEHPFVVIYRNSVASFLDNDIELRKLGISGIPGVLQVKTIQMQPDDLLIIGSDGRDDVAVGTDKMGNRIINEDENLFLRHVESAGGDLRKIEEKILGTGDLTDDFTLMRIGFKEDLPLSEKKNIQTETPEYRQQIKKARQFYRSGDLQNAASALYTAIEQADQNADAMRSLARLLIRLGQHQEASRIAERYAETHSADSQFLFVASYAFGKAGQSDIAIDYGERCRLREPFMIKNLIFLARLHLKAGRRTIAERILQEALERDPNNIAVQKFLSSL